MSKLESIAYGIGISEAHKNGCIVPAAKSQLMMEFMRKNSKKVGDSIPWLIAYNKGVADEIGLQATLEL